MKALSIRQPWAWHIIRPDLTDPAARAKAYADGLIKDIENRSWATKFRGRVLVHASLGMTRGDYEDGCDPLWINSGPTIQPPPYHELQRGGIIGSVEIVDCVDWAQSLWFFGPFGFVLRDARPLPFMPYKGALGFFDVPEVQSC